VVANLGRRKYVLFGGKVGADNTEDFWWYPNGDVEGIHEISCEDEQIADPFIIFLGLEVSESRGVGEYIIRAPARESDRGVCAGWWKVSRHSQPRQGVDAHNGCKLLS